MIVIKNTDYISSLYYEGTKTAMVSNCMCLLLIRNIL